MYSEKAHIDPSAKIGKNVTIHPFAFIDKDVEIGDNCEIMPFASILHGTRMGSDCRVFQGAIVGAEPQDFRWDGSDTYCFIGSHVTIRENVIINRGIKADGGTFIGNDTWLMAGVRVGHDSRIEGNSIIGDSSKIAGGVIIDQYSILSAACIIHEGAHIGKWVFVKGGCRISGNVPPYIIVAHNPVSYFGVNATVMSKSKSFTADTIDDIAKAYRHLYQSGTSVFNALQRIEADVARSAERDEITNFIKNSNMKVVAAAVDLE